MVTLFYTKIHNEFFIFLGVALHYTIYHMKEKKQENSKFLKKKRKYIETVFSKLVNLFDIERIRVQSILGFRLRLEQCLLVYTIKNELAQ